MASLEERIETLTTAVEKLTAAVEAGGIGGGAAATGAKTAAATTGAKAGAAKADKPKASAKSKYTADQVKAGIVNVKDNVGEDEARTIIQTYAGEGKKLADLVTMPQHFDAVMADVEAALAGGGDEPEEDGDDGL